mmetsp:Transcript_45826/g.147145  ORF Transcript_45826/g.147145 Transcript_45826/m.147145 type:complete len:318 (-) Transcript_45826:132-1085(-)
MEAREADRELAEKLGVWSTPYVVDPSTEEPFIGETTLPLLALQLRRSGRLKASLAPGACDELPVAPRQPPPAPSAAVTPAGSRRRVEVYVDLKSPYAFLAIEPTYALQEDFDVELVWRPYVLDIAGFLGSAEVGAQDNKVRQGTNERSPGQWRAVKYAYANVRRYAAERRPPLTVYGTRKIWDTSLAGIAMLFAERRGRLRDFQQRLWPSFWRRDLDAEDLGTLAAVLRASGVDTAGFEEFVAGDGRRELMEIQEEATRRGIFGVPSYVLDGEMFFGREHLALLRLRLFEAGCATRTDPAILAAPYLSARNELFAGF